MREVIVYNVSSTTSFPTPAEQYRGHLIGFAVSTQVSDGTPETDTMAMIEREDGRVSMVLPNRIQFVQPYRAQLAATPANIARACGMENEVEEAQEVSATNPPRGFALMKEGEVKKNGYIVWDRSDNQWFPGLGIGDIWGPNQLPCANPIKPVPGSDAKRLPEGYELAREGGTRKRGYMYLSSSTLAWTPGNPDFVGHPVEYDGLIANPIEVTP